MDCLICIKMKKVSVYVKGDRNSTDYYRIYQYLDKLHGEECRCVYRIQMGDKFYRKWMPVSDKPLYIKIFVYLYIYFRRLYGLLNDWIYVPDIVVLHRGLIGRYMPYSFRILLKSIISRGAKLIWDYDDHIMANNEVSKFTFNEFANLSSHVLITHDYLKSLLPIYCQSKAIKLPTTDGDMYNLFSPKINEERLSLLDKQVNLVWVATGRNIRFLKSIVPVLDKAAHILYESSGRSLILKVICNVPLKCECSLLKIENIPWTRQNAIQGMIESHIGLMPLADSEFTRGKGGFKLVQYLSIGLPCIGSDVGYNHSVVSADCGFVVQTNKDWITAILKLSDTSLWESYSKCAFSRWRHLFSYEKNLEVWRCLING